MAKKLQLSIPEPCHENWDAMTPVEKGRFCGACQKQVVDFSTMNDRQVAEFFKKPSTGSVCGRFMTDQLERDFEIPKKRIPWFKYFFQIALPAFLVSIKATSAKAQGQVQLRLIRTTVDTTKKQAPGSIILSDTDRMIFGNVTDEKGDPIPGATIVVKGKRVGVAADNNGSFRILAKTGDVLVATSSSHETTEITLGKTNTISLTMRSLFISGTEVVVVAGGISVSYDRPKKVKPTKEIVEEVITGIVMDEKTNPVPGVSVIIKGTSTGTTTNATGEFSIRATRKDVLRIASVGFEMKDVDVKDQKSITIYLRSMTLGGISFTKTKKKKELKDVPLITDAKCTNDVAFKIFPNPVEAGTTLNIELQKIEEGYHTIDLINQSGQFVHQQELWIGVETKQLGINIPGTTAGNYFIVMTNKKTGKKSTEKIIIQ